MGFIIKNKQNDSYIVSIQKGVSFTTDLNKAYQWDRKKSALNVCKNLLNEKKNKKKNVDFIVIDAAQEAVNRVDNLLMQIKKDTVDNNNAVNDVDSGDSEIFSPELECDFDNNDTYEHGCAVISEGKITNTNPDISIAEMYDNIYEIINYINGLKHQHECLKEELKNTELEIQDFLHVIEFCEISEQKELELYEELKQLRLKRRKYKDQIYLIDQLDRIFPTESQMNNLKKSYAFISSRNYSLRIRQDLVNFLNEQ